MRETGTLYQVHIMYSLILTQLNWKFNYTDIFCDYISSQYWCTFKTKTLPHLQLLINVLCIENVLMYFSSLGEDKPCLQTKKVVPEIAVDNLRKNKIESWFS